MNTSKLRERIAELRNKRPPMAAAEAIDAAYKHSDWERDCTCGGCRAFTALDAALGRLGENMPADTKTPTVQTRCGGYHNWEERIDPNSGGYMRCKDCGAVYDAEGACEEGR